MLTIIVAVLCLIWYIAVVLVCTIGFVQLHRHYSAPPRCSSSDRPRPHMTIIRPVKGDEPELYACLSSTFRQTYPRDRLTIFFCVESAHDPSYPVLQDLIRDFPEFDAALLVEEEDEELRGPKSIRLGPNPKIRNMSRAYREAKGDIIWIVDCNVWVGPGVASRMVDTLLGADGRPYKFVHQLPLVVDIVGPVHGSLLRSKGGRLEEMFLATSHAKFYTAINTVSIAPCIVGKSNMFRRSHLNALTNGEGIDFFSRNICEDHLIGDLLWKSPVPSHLRSSTAPAWGQHALCFGDLAIQPMSGMRVSEYCARRVRWLRVRKYTVMLATLVEPGTESFLCSAYGAFAVTTLPWFRTYLPSTWTAFAAFWLLSVTIWAIVDRRQYRLLHSAVSLEKTADTSRFVRGQRRLLGEWMLAWLGREALALPIWLWAVYGGATVNWRGKDFWVDMQMNVHESRHGPTPKRE